jgi:hypothetical protein
MNKTPDTPKAKRVWLKPRRPTTAADGGAFLTLQDIMKRWGLSRTTALAHLHGIARYHFSDQTTRFRVDDIIRYEESLRS